MGDYNLLADVLTLSAEQADGDFDDANSQNLHNRQFFVDAMNHAYNEIAARYHCGCAMSERRLMEAYDYWQEDSMRTLGRGIDKNSPTLDHFKHAAFICFWLRRTHPVNTIQGVRPVPLIERSANEKFFQYGNEICAIFIGLQLCIFYELSKSKIDSVTVRELPSRVSQLARLSLPPELIDDFSMILKHKSMSPYAIYLMYKSLFNNTVPA